MLVSADGLSQQCRHTPLTLHSDDTTAYSSLLVRLGKQIHPISSQLHAPCASRHIRNLITELNCLTPTISAAAASATSCVTEVRHLDIPAHSRADKYRERALQQMTTTLRKTVASIAAKYSSLSTRASSTAETVSAASRKKEAIRNSQAQTCLRLEDSLHITRTGVRQTNSSLRELTGVLELARERRRIARTRLILFRVANSVSSPFGHTFKKVVQKARSEASAASRIVERVVRDRTDLLQHRDRSVAEFLRFAVERKKEGRALAVCDDEMQGLATVAYALRVVSIVMREIVLLWQRVEETFARIEGGARDETPAKSVEDWHTIAVILRMFFSAHKEATRAMLAGIFSNEPQF